MKIEKTNLENHEAKLNVTVEAEEFAPFMNKAAKKIAQSQRIPGFRPGKAPISVIRTMFGEQAIAQEATDLFLEEKYSDILKQAEVEPGAMGRIESIESINPPAFSLIIPLETVVELGDYREIREEWVDAELTDDEITKAMEELKKPYAAQEPVETEIAEGNSVFTMIKGETDEPLEEGGDTELVAEMPYEFEVGKDTDPATAFPFVNFTKELIGHKAGETLTIPYTYPEDTNIPGMAGKKATYTVTIQSVKALTMPAEDDEFAKNFGEDMTMETLKEKLVEQLKKQKDDTVRSEFIEKVVDKLVAGAKIVFAPAVLEEEVNNRLESIKEQVKTRGMEFETWLKLNQTDETKYVAEQIRPAAEEQLKRRLALGEFAKVEKIGIDFERYKEVFSEIRQQYGSYIESIKNKKQRDNILNQIGNQAFNEAFLSNSFGRLIAIAKGENPAIEDPDEKAAEEAAKQAAEAAAEIEAEEKAE